MGKYSYNEKPLKPLKKGLFFVFVPVVCMILEVIIVLLTLAALRGMNISSSQLSEGINMLAVAPIMLVGVGLFLIYGAIEKIYRSKNIMKWWHFILAGYVIPLILWGIASVFSLTKWWSDRNNEDAIFFKWFTLTFLVYLSCAAVYRILLQLVIFFINKKTEKRK